MISRRWAMIMEGCHNGGRVNRYVERVNRISVSVRIMIFSRSKMHSRSNFSLRSVVTKACCKLSSFPFLWFKLKSLEDRCSSQTIFWGFAASYSDADCSMNCPLAQKYEMDKTARHKTIIAHGNDAFRNKTQYILMN